MRATSATLWTRAPAAGAVTLEVLPPTGGTRFDPLRTYALRARAADDRTVKRVVTGLRPGTRHRYRFSQRGVTSQIGRFTTGPLPNANWRVRSRLPGTPTRRPARTASLASTASRPTARWHREATTSTQLRRHDLLRLRARGRAVARTVTQKRAKYRLGLALEPLRRLRASAGALQRLGRPRVRQRLLGVQSTAPRSTAQACGRSSTTRRRGTVPTPASTAGSGGGGT